MADVNRMTTVGAAGGARTGAM
ncbi:MAG: hypothetical protein RL531_884, partial [Actinomycetota bacterium]